MIINHHDPAAQHITATTRKDLDMYRHPIVDEVDHTMRSRWREASEQQLVARVRRAADRQPGVRQPGVRGRVGSWLVRTGYWMGAPRRAS